MNLHDPRSLQWTEVPSRMYSCLTHGRLWIQNKDNGVADYDTNVSDGGKKEK